MSPKSDRPDTTLNVADPFALWRSWRDINLEIWAQGSANIVNTAAFSQMLGAYLNNYLTFYAPFQAVFDKYQEALLSSLRMPSRTETTQLSQRMTHIEMRLDDLDAKFDQVVQVLQTRAPAQVSTAEEQIRPESTRGNTAEPTGTTTLDMRLRTLDDKTDQLLHLLGAWSVAPAGSNQTRTRRANVAEASTPTAADASVDNTAY